MLSNSTRMCSFFYIRTANFNSLKQSETQYALCLVHSCKYTVTENNKQHINNDMNHMV